MFDLFKKKNKPSNEKLEEVLSEEQITEIKNRIIQNQAVVETVPSIEEKAKIYETLGLDYAQLKDALAIPSLEKSLELKLSMGDGYKKLMHLYNAKRAEAARNGDDQGIEKYMNKMDDMRQIAKKLTISRGK